MSNYNAVPPYQQASLKQLHEAFGILKFSSGSETNWYQTIAGLLFQGGLVEAAAANAETVVNFNVGFPKQCLGIFLQSIHDTTAGPTENSGKVKTTYTKDGFTLVNDGDEKDFFWFALGV